jgi:hypothetical protein
VSTYDDSNNQCFVFDQQSAVISWWDSFLVIGVIYSTAYTPLVIVFPQARWRNHQIADVTLDVLFCADMLVRFRTAFRDHGYDVTQPRTIAAHYLRGWFALDFFSSVPVDRLAGAWRATSTVSMLDTSSAQRPISLVDILSLLRIMRIGRLVRKLSALTGANFLRIMYLMYLFVLFGHWLGLVWYAIAIRPIEASAAYDAARPWLWTMDEDSSYFVALR